MIRFAPNLEGTVKPGPVEPFWRSIGGDELNVCVDLARLNVPTRFVTVLGTSPLSDWAVSASEEAGVTVHAERVASEQVGTFHVVPEEKRVYYHRQHSAFARQAPGLFDWEMLLQGAKWLHMTGITPMCGAKAANAWQLCMDATLQRNIHVSLDLNHRPQLGSLEELWSKVRPYASRLRVMILSRGQLLALALLEQIKLRGLTPESPASDNKWGEVLQELREVIQTEYLLLPMKTRVSGLQTRWSLAASPDGLISTEKIPVLHRPVENIGGGSAWAAGLIDFFLAGDCNRKLEVATLRHGDLMAALCQETPGDWSMVNREELCKAAAKHVNEVYNLASESEQDTAAHKAALASLKDCKVVAILRAKNAEAAIERGQELSRMGCRALEVTMDTTDVLRVLKTLVDTVGPHTLVGVGTVMHKEQVAKVAAMGAKFALSPINPKGFIGECKKYGLVCVPAAFSPNEVFDMYQAGADVIKLFPAHIWAPNVLKAMKGVGEFSTIPIAPSGGVSPTTYKAWLAAGAVGCGMGSALTGGDLKYKTGSPEFVKARIAWNATGRSAAEGLFKHMDDKASSL